MTGGNISRRAWAIHLEIERAIADDMVPNQTLVLAG
jgi:hypothetical protein